MRNHQSRNLCCSIPFSFVPRRNSVVFAGQQMIDFIKCVLHALVVRGKQPLVAIQCQAHRKAK